MSTLKEIASMSRENACKFMFKKKKKTANYTRKSLSLINPLTLKQSTDSMGVMANS